jgi:hypothetical protein
LYEEDFILPILMPPVLTGGSLLTAMFVLSLFLMCGGCEEENRRGDRQSDEYWQALSARTQNTRRVESDARLCSAY